MRRLFHGCYAKGRNIVYYRPSGTVNGPLWTDHFIDPKTKRPKNYTLYGGKLAGILTQSFCRELFFEGLADVHRRMQQQPSSLQLIGQFHDEIVLESGNPADTAAGIQLLEQAMTTVPYWALGFPLDAKVKSDLRYTK